MGRNDRLRFPPAVAGCGCCLPNEQRRLPRRQRSLLLCERRAPAVPVFTRGDRIVGVFLAGLSPRLGRGERDEAVAVFVPLRLLGAERVGVIRG